MHGIYYDDTEYDYMQHLRGLNEGEAVFIEAVAGPKKKRKQKLEDALKLPKEVLPSEVEIRRTYQDMQDVPDALGGFQPDMDPRLREVLEALEDEEYVDDDEDVFGELAKGEEVDEKEFVEDDGWESDITEKPANREAGERGEEESGWEGAFREFKKKQKGVVFDDGSLVDTMSFGGGSSLGGTMSVSGRSRRRRRKNGTESSGYSMSSSALFRTEGLTLLDDRFDKVPILTQWLITNG
jgi:protein LTV1